MDHLQQRSGQGEDPRERSVGRRAGDDGVGLGKSEAAGNGRALANCKERLRLTYGDGASLNVATRAEGGTRAHLSLPAAVTAVAS